MFYRASSIFRLNGSFIFDKHIGRCFGSFISLSGLSYSFRKTNSLTNRPFLSRKSVVFNSSLSKVTMVKEDLGGPVIRLTDYDCIGFDLDNTLCEYNLNSIIQMEYDALCSFLIQERGYPEEVLGPPLQHSEMDFLQRGLLLDLKKGNILKVNAQGTILKARHGTKEMSASEITAVYGENKQWEVTNTFCKDMISTWNGPLATKLRALLDFFDISASLAFARGVDYMDKVNGGPLECYSIGEDILASLVHTYKRDHYPSGISKFFKEIKADQGRYTSKCDDTVVEWLKQMRSENKVTFLITGSNVDFASFTAEYSLGKNWRDLFDIVICYAKKPGFFINSSPFISLNGFEEGSPIKYQNLERGGIYNQGNWRDLKHFFTKLTGKANPDCLYFGDNVVQDVYTPSKFCNCDTVAVIEELNSEITTEGFLPWLKSDKWGSYFKYSSENATVWGNAIRTYSKICIPSIKFIAGIPLSAELQTFSKEKNGDVAGFHPVIPVSLKQTPQS